MGFGLKTEAHFNAAHFLTDFQGKCENIHGHRWRVVVYLYADTLDTAGENRDMLIDFGVFKKAVREEVAKFDHQFIVERGSLADDTIACLERETFSLLMVDFRTTAENFARYFYTRLTSRGFGVSRVDVYETPNNCAIYYGPCGAPHDGSEHGSDAPVVHMA